MSTQPSSTLLTIALGMAAGLLLGGCSAQEPRSTGHTHESTQRPSQQCQPATHGRTAGEQAAVVAARQVGVPYPLQQAGK